MKSFLPILFLLVLLMLAACGKEAEQTAPASSAPPAATTTAAPDSAASEPAASPPDAAATGGDLQASMARGEKLFATHCTACHQADGQGLAGAFPPLAGSDYLTPGGTEVINNVIHGISGPITVNGKDYNSMMPPMPYINDNDLADIANFVMNSWGNPGGEYTAADVAEARKR